MMDLMNKVKKHIDHLNENRRQQLPKNDRRIDSEGKVVAFINQKGGVGKTTMCFNTARALSEKGKKVLCLDMDPQANLSLLFGIDLAKKSKESNQNHYGLYHLLVNSVRELKALHVPVVYSEVVSSGEKMDLIPGSMDLSGLELSLATLNTTPKQLILKRFIEKNDLLKLYDVILIDAPPTLGLLVVNILCACHGVIIPFRPDEFSRKGLEHFYEILNEVEEMGISETPKVLGHIPNLVDPRRKQEELDLERITQFLGELAPIGQTPFLFGPFYNRAPLVRAQAQGKSVFDYTSGEFRELQEQFSLVADSILDLAQPQTRSTPSIHNDYENLMQK